MLMHADNRGVDHLDNGIMSSGKRIYDPTPDISPPPAYEALVASSVWTKRLGQITPGCSGSEDPEDAIEDTAAVNPRNAPRLVGQHRLDEFGSLNHRGLTKRNAPGLVPVRRLRSEADIN